MVNENAWIILFYKFKLECFLWDKINITLFSGPQVFQVWNYFRNKIGFDGWWVGSTTCRSGLLGENKWTGALSSSVS